MAKACAITGRKASFGNQKTYRGKAKYLGGVGRKVTSTTKRTFRPNLQRIQVETDGTVTTKRVCTQCIRSGRVKRPQKRKLFQMPTSL